jgi:hypothetical protein
MMSAPLIVDTGFDRAKGIDILPPRRCRRHCLWSTAPILIWLPASRRTRRSARSLYFLWRGSQGLHRLSGAVSKRQGYVAPPATGPRAECSVREHGAMGSMALTRGAAATGRRGACCSPRRSAEQQCRTYR